MLRLTYLEVGAVHDDVEEVEGVGPLALDRLGQVVLVDCFWLVVLLLGGVLVLGGGDREGRHSNRPGDTGRDVVGCCRPHTTHTIHPPPPSLLRSSHQPHTHIPT